MLRVLPLRVFLPYSSEQEFIRRYGTNVSRGGMFLSTQAIQPQGTRLHFEMVLRGNETLLKGEAIVAKVLVDAGGERKGMTLAFSQLDDASKGVVDRIVESRVEQVKRSRQIDPIRKQPPKFSAPVSQRVDGTEALRNRRHRWLGRVKRFLRRKLKRELSQ